MKTRIDHNNYEAFLLDRMEGNLSPDQERELDTFLLMNPELAPELDVLPSLTKNEFTLSNLEKEALKRTLPPLEMPGEAPLDDLLIAQLEGDLTSEQSDALRSYLIAHPEHQNAERLYALTKLVPQAMAFSEKQLLHRDLPPVGLPTNYSAEDFLIARLEGDLNAGQEKAIAAMIATDPSVARSWMLMQHTHLKAETIVYPHKASLKKGGKVIAISAPRWQMALAIAASVLVLLGIGFWMLRDTTNNAPQLAEKVEPEAGSNTNDGINSEGTPAAEESGSEQLRDLNSGVEENKVISSEDGSIKPRSNYANEALGRKEKVVPDTPPVPREEPLKLAHQKHVVPTVDVDRPTPENVVVPYVPAYQESLDEMPTPVHDTKTVTVGELFASTVREHLLDEADPSAGPLDRHDAVAAVDKGLKVIAGDKAGLSYERTNGRRRSFDLRLGRNLSITARR